MATFAYEAGLRLGMTKSAGGNMKRTRLGAGVGAVGGGIIGALLKAKTRKQRVLNALKGVGIGGLAGGGLGLAADAHGILRDTVDDYIDRFQPPDVRHPYAGVRLHVRHPYFDFDWLPGANTRGVAAGLAGLGIGATGGGLLGALRKAESRKQRVRNILSGAGIGGFAGGVAGYIGGTEADKDNIVSKYDMLSDIRRRAPMAGSPASRDTLDRYRDINLRAENLARVTGNLEGFLGYKGDFSELLQRRNYQLSKGLNTPGLNMHNYEWIDPEIWQDRINLHYGKDVGKEFTRVPGLSAAEMDYVRRLESILHD